MTRPRRLKVVVEADGGARGNPGPAGYGAVVSEAATGEVLVDRSESIGVATNNVAEYRGLIAGLQAAADLGAVDVEVRMDSKLVVEQMSGRWQIKNAALRDLAARASILVQRFDTVRFTWIPRAENHRADALANAAMDGRPAPEVDLSPPGPVSRPAASTSTSTPAPGSTSGSGSGAGSRSTSGSATASASALGQAAPRRWMPPSSSTATRLVLVRHGETELTAQGRYSGRGDVPLSTVGIRQAEATAARLATVVSLPATVISSPLSRCLATAREIAARLGVDPPQPEPDLIECDFGQWEGLTFADVRKGWPDEMDEWMVSPAIAPPGGESFETVATRALAAVARLADDRAGQTLILVSHVSPIKLILRDALAATDSFLYRLFLDPAGISIVDTWKDGGIAVRSVNDTAHLAP